MVVSRKRVEGHWYGMLPCFVPIFPCNSVRNILCHNSKVETRTERSDALLFLIQYEINPQELHNNCFKFLTRQQENTLLNLSANMDGISLLDRRISDIILKMYYFKIKARFFSFTLCLFVSQNEIEENKRGRK